MGHPLSMISRLIIMAVVGSFVCVHGVQAKTKVPAENPSSQNAKAATPAEQNANPAQNAKAMRNSLTIKQVERATGGQVIGVRQVSFQGRQLNMIKLKMPDGRIKIYSRLFDDYGRSVENIDSMDAVTEPESSDVEP